MMKAIKAWFLSSSQETTEQTALLNEGKIQKEEGVESELNATPKVRPLKPLYDLAAIQKAIANNDYGVLSEQACLIQQEILSGAPQTLIELLAVVTEPLEGVRGYEFCLSSANIIIVRHSERNSALEAEGIERIIRQARRFSPGDDVRKALEPIEKVGEVLDEFLHSYGEIYDVWHEIFEKDASHKGPAKYWEVLDFLVEKIDTMDGSLREEAGTLFVEYLKKARWHRDEHGLDPIVYASLVETAFRNLDDEDSFAEPLAEIYADIYQECKIKPEGTNPLATLTKAIIDVGGDSQLTVQMSDVWQEDWQVLAKKNWGAAKALILEAATHCEEKDERAGDFFYDIMQEAMTQHFTSVAEENPEQAVKTFVAFAKENELISNNFAWHAYEFCLDYPQVFQKSEPEWALPVAAEIVSTFCYHGRYGSYSRDLWNITVDAWAEKDLRKTVRALRDIDEDTLSWTDHITQKKDELQALRDEKFEPLAEETEAFIEACKAHRPLSITLSGRKNKHLAF